MAQPPFPDISPAAPPGAASACSLQRLWSWRWGYSGQTWAPPPQSLKTTCCILSSPVGREKISSRPGNSLRPVPAANGRPPPPPAPSPATNERPPPAHFSSNERSFKGTPPNSPLPLEEGTLSPVLGVCLWCAESACHNGSLSALSRISHLPLAG